MLYLIGINKLMVLCDFHVIKIYTFYLLESVPITTKVVSSNPTHGEVYSIQHDGIKLVSDLRHSGGFLLKL